MIVHEEVLTDEEALVRLREIARTSGWWMLIDILGGFLCIVLSAKMIDTNEILAALNLGSACYFFYSAWGNFGALDYCITCIKHLRYHQ